MHLPIPRRITAMAVILLTAIDISAFTIENLKTDHLDTPIGLDSKNPRFSWQMKYDTDEQPSMQKSYSISVTDENGHMIWESGDVISESSINIPYQGCPLRPSTRYRWTVTVKDNTDTAAEASSWWETGLLDSGWNNARWIGPDENDMTFYSDYLPVFRISYDVQIPRKGNSASLLYGVNDPRLMNRDLNLYNIESPRNESYIKITLNLNGLRKNKNATLDIYRKGYHPGDKTDKPFAVLDIPDSIINRKNAYATHRIAFNSILGTTEFDIDGHRIGTAELNPVGRGGDYIAFPVVGQIGFMAPKGSSAVFSNVEVGHFRTPSRKIADIQSEPLTVNGRTIILDRIDKSAPMLRTEFDITDSRIVKGRLYATARGAYDFYINGNPVTDTYLNPGLTEYDKTHLYQTYDVTPLLRRGRNAMGAVLTEGWWSGGATFVGYNWNYYGDRPSMKAKLIVEYADSTQETFVTTPDGWKYFDNGPLLYGSLFQGEVYDATLEKDVRGWTEPNFDSSSWKNSSIVEEPKFDGTMLTSGTGIEVKVLGHIQARSMTEPRPGIYVYDMGQNMAGVPDIKLNGLIPGTKVNLRFAEVMYPDMPRYEGHEGMIMLENIRAAMAQDIYKSKGGTETISPRSTYHGFRYIEVSGIDSALPLEAVAAIPLSSLGDVKASYTTSNERVNQLWNNMLWSSRSNFLSIPTDCPQRNERMGWTGDISVFSRTALHIADLYPFLRSYLRSMRDTQRPSGKYEEVVPMSGGFGGLLWGSAGITVPWECYQMTADTLILAEHYESMKRYIDYVTNHDIDPSTGIIVQDHQWGDLGDWLGLEYDQMDKSLIWEAYYIYDLEIMRNTAMVLGNTADAARYDSMRSKRIKFFNDTYIDPQSGKTRFSAFVPEKEGSPVDLQTSYAVPLAFGIVDDSHLDLFRQNFLATVSRENHGDDGRTYPPYSLMTGFIGTAWISKALSECGATDYAYRLLLQRSFPSWLYPVDQGATTVWERLNSFTLSDGFGSNNSMNSFNHYSFGSVGSWMINYSLGIRRDDSQPGWKHFILAPEPDPTGEMTLAKGHFDSPYGRIESSWKIEDGRAIYDFYIPANTTATLILPGSKSHQAPATLTPGHHHFELTFPPTDR